MPVFWDTARCSLLQTDITALYPRSRPRWPTGSVLVTGPMTRGMKLGRGRWTHNDLRREVNRRPHVGMLENPTRMKKYLVGKFNCCFFAKFPASILEVSAGNCKELWGTND